MNYKQVLVAITDRDWNDEVSDWLKALPDIGGSLIVNSERSEQDASKRLKRSPLNAYQLIVTEIGIAADRKTPRNDKDRRGLELLKSLNSLPYHIPSILIAPKVDNELVYTTHELYRCFLVEPDATMFERCAKYVQQAFDLSSLGSVDEVVRITFELDPDRGLGFGYRIEGIGFSYSDRGVIEIDKAVIEDLLQRSASAREIKNYPNWENHLRALGRILVQKLLLDTLDLQAAYWSIVGNRRVEICFDVARSMHPVILEALIEPKSLLKQRGSPEAGEFWMLKASIYRRLRNERPTDMYPLFQGSPRSNYSRQINCLIIQADVEGSAPAVRGADGRPLSLPALPHVREEAEMLEKYLEDLKKLRPDLCIGEVCRIRLDKLAPDQNFRDYVERTLNIPDQPWHLVHYAGHCHYDDEAGKGYLFFPGSAFIEEVDLSTFSSWLCRSQFVFLSACNTSEEQVVFELANNHVPAALGFRWEIEDDLAFEYTRAFYEELFKTKSLEYAFLRTRNRMRKVAAWSKKRFWAAPLLILQLNQAGYSVKYQVPPENDENAA
jgi:hypothetical protein